jgi:predicted Zn-dependent protease
MKTRSISLRHAGLLAALALALAVVTGCSTVPITGRQQLMMVSDREMATLGDKSYSSFMSLAAKHNAVATPSDSPAWAAAIERVKRVSDRIIDAAGLRGKHQWETTLVKNKAANARVYPNGKIVVFSGLLPVAQNDAGLAAVLGHEVAHVVARHGAERLSQYVLAQTVAVAAGAVAASKSNVDPAAVSAAIGIGAQYGVLLPFSREHESEADRIGLLYMARAGYDPAEAIALWERMEQANGSGPWEFLSTHPNPATRRQQIRAWLPEAQVYYADPNRPLPSNLSELDKARRAGGLAAAAR